MSRGIKRTVVTLFATILVSVPAAPAVAGLTAPADAEADYGTNMYIDCSAAGGPERDPAVTGRVTVRSITTARGTIQVRAGYWRGKQRGWARVLNGNQSHYIVMKIDLNGDRVPDQSTGWRVGLGNSNATCIAETSPSPNRAFKACVRLDSNYDAPCHPGHQTAWW